VPAEHSDHAVLSSALRKKDPGAHGAQALWLVAVGSAERVPGGHSAHEDVTAWPVRLL